ncbi:Histone acetyltransferase lsy-12 [Caenorhabditis elegans]|uniref:Isoform c of Histone acetyltransferase lsy-12 n=1 Tax=Caenorhabditis elegans TaxID=6239 RepID=K8ERR8-4|nr:Histone acetyltransferase lsy-12 [Caenorhabditis elegans]CBM41217.2 Histone acetyltransferase lsy-12 [Caenorhabditis elegans]|eukprot:NP_001256145.1 Histone acetyltransferase [Caenorhabditis elegans]
MGKKRKPSPERSSDEDEVSTPSPKDRTARPTAAARRENVALSQAVALSLEDASNFCSLAFSLERIKREPVDTDYDDPNQPGPSSVPVSARTDHVLPIRFKIKAEPQEYDSDEYGKDHGAVQIANKEVPAISPIEEVSQKRRGRPRKTDAAQHLFFPHVSIKQEPDDGFINFHESRCVGIAQDPEMQHLHDVNESHSSEIAIFRETKKITERKKKKTEAEKLWDNMSLTEKEVFQSHTRRRRTTRLPIIQNFEETEEGCIVEVPIPLIDLDNDAVESVTGPQHENVTVSENVLSTESTDQEVTETKRLHDSSRDFNPPRIQDTPSTVIRPEGDQKDPMLSNDQSEIAKRPRTPRPRYSPEAQRRTNSRLSALTIDTNRSNDLNVDGSAPSSSSAASCGLSTPDPDRTSQQRRKGNQSAARSRKIKTPSPPLSQEDEPMELDSDDDPVNELDNLPIVIDDPSYVLTKEHKEIFEQVKKSVSDRNEFSPAQISEIYRSSKGEQARLPERIHFGAFIMKTWYGSPFPAEFINVKKLFICEFCFFYARSDEIMQNHAKKCMLRAPPGLEIYRKGDISVFEVDGRLQKEYCQTLCLVSRMFLESKTVFYDTEPFFFYIVTINDDIGCHFAGYFSKEKYEPDVNNLSCIMTLPCYQEMGLGRFLIDISYALSRKEKWFGGPEQPLSELGRKAYGGYWRTTIASCLGRLKDELEFGSGISIKMIADDTGVNCHDILEVVCSLGWAKPVDPDEKNHYKLEWDVDWDMVSIILRESEASKETKVQYDPECLDWVPRKMRPSMDGYHELSKEEIEQDEQRRKSIQKTPVHVSMEKATPTSTTSLPVGSVKKELRSRGHNRSVGRNLKHEVNRKVKVPEWAAARDLTDEEITVEENKKQQKQNRKIFTRCADSVLDKSNIREETPEDDEPGPSTKPSGKRQRGNKCNNTESEPNPSGRKTSATSSGRGKYRNRRTDGTEEEEEDDDPTDSEPLTTDDEKPFETSVNKEKNEKSRRGKKVSKKRRSVAGKKFPPNFGVRDRDEPKKAENSEDGEGLESKPGPSTEMILVEKVEEEEAKVTVSDINMQASESKIEGIEQTSEVDIPKSDEDHQSTEAYDRVEDEVPITDYNIPTPDSYHSSPPHSPTPSPQPQLMQAQQNIYQDNDCHFAENDSKPPHLVSEVDDPAAPQPTVTLQSGPSDAPPLSHNSVDGYSTGDDDAPPNLSPQIGKSENNEEEMPLIAPIVQHNGITHHEESTAQHYHDSMNAGPSTSSHVTPQMSMINTTPQQPPFSHPNSQQQATPGSGGVPSCGPAYTHHTPEQQSQQFMSPPMAGMPASVASNHSIHNSNSIEMVGGPASLQHTPQQYEMGHSMAQESAIGGINTVPSIEQQNQLMLQHHQFSSPPAAPPPSQQQQVVQPPIPPAPTTANGRRRSESAATQRTKARQQHQHQQQQPQQPQQRIAAPGVPQGVHPQMQFPMNAMNMMPAYPPFYPYTNYPNIWQPPYQNYPYNQVDYQQPWLYNNGHIPHQTNGTATNQFHPGHMGYFPNNNGR